MHFSRLADDDARTAAAVDTEQSPRRLLPRTGRPWRRSPASSKAMSTRCCRFDVRPAHRQATTSPPTCCANRSGTDRCATKRSSASCATGLSVRSARFPQRSGSWPTTSRNMAICSAGCAPGRRCCRPPSKRSCGFTGRCWPTGASRLRRWKSATERSRPASGFRCSGLLPIGMLACSKIRVHFAWTVIGRESALRRGNSRLPGRSPGPHGNARGHGGTARAHDPNRPDPGQAADRRVVPRQWFRHTADADPIDRLPTLNFISIEKPALPAAEGASSSSFASAFGSPACTCACSRACCIGTGPRNLHAACSAVFARDRPGFRGCLMVGGAGGI